MASCGRESYKKADGQGKDSLSASLKIPPACMTCSEKAESND